jgi:hypothetical protein
MKRILAAAFLAALATTSLVAQTKQASKGKASEAATPSPLVEEKGKLTILLDGKPVGTEEFEIARSGKDWEARGTTRLQTPGEAATQVTARMRLSADGAPLHYQWSTSGPKKASATVVFENNVAKLTLQMESAKPYEQLLSFGTRVVILDNNLYHDYAILARIYDWNARGTQTFAVLIPQDMTPGSITVEDGGPQKADGGTLDLLRVKTADLAVELYLDASHRLLRLAVPAAKAEIRRE